MTSTGKTPLSDLMVLSAADETGWNFHWFIEEFRKSQVGVAAFGLPSGQTGTFLSTEANPISVGIGALPGNRFLIACADPEEFAIRFGWQFNVLMSGDSLISTALHNPECEGIQVNSAITKTSIIVERQTSEAIAEKHRPSPGRPWWKFWW